MLSNKQKLSIAYKSLITKTKSISSKDIIDACHVTKINYPVRIHEIKICKCKRIQTKILSLKLNINQQIIYIIEKLWNDEIYKKFPNFIYISDKINDLDHNNADKILNFLFEESAYMRRYIYEYFNKYEWSKDLSILVRKNVLNMSTICFCNDNLLVDKMMCNSGFIIIGTKEQMQIISHCFNKYVKKTEISKVCIIKIGNISKLNKKYINHNIELFIKSSEIKLINKSFYTLLGLQSKKYLSNPQILTYSFPFGKREWYNNMIETSLECAKRELYEEFNLQFSKKIWDYSNSTNGPKHIHSPGSNLYFLHLPMELSIWYHKNSDTIYLEKK